MELLIDFRADVNAQFEGRSILSDLLQREWIESEQIEIAEMLFKAGAEATEEERTRLCDLLKKPVVPQKLG